MWGLRLSIKKLTSAINNINEERNVKIGMTLLFLSPYRSKNKKIVSKKIDSVY